MVELIYLFRLDPTFYFLLTTDSSRDNSVQKHTEFASYLDVSESGQGDGEN